MALVWMVGETEQVPINECNCRGFLSLQFRLGHNRGWVTGFSGSFNGNGRCNGFSLVYNIAGLSTALRYGSCPGNSSSE